MDRMAEKSILLTSKNDEYKELVESYAEKKRDHRIALKGATIQAKTDGQSVTLIPTISKGVAADAEFEMIVAEGIMKACLESMKDIRAQIDMARSMLTWLRVEKVNP